jgi:hypothetical protein
MMEVVGCWTEYYGGEVKRVNVKSNLHLTLCQYRLLEMVNVDLTTLVRIHTNLHPEVDKYTTSGWWQTLVLDYSACLDRRRLSETAQQATM